MRAVRARAVALYALVALALVAVARVSGCACVLRRDAAWGRPRERMAWGAAHGRLLRAQAADPDIFQVIKQAARGSMDMPPTVDRVETMLKDIASKVEAEQHLTQAQYQLTVKEYTDTIARYNETLQSAIANKTQLIKRMQYDQLLAVKLKQNVSTLDERIRAKQRVLAHVEQELNDFTKLRRDQNLRFQGRYNFTLRSLQGIIHVLDQLGDENAFVRDSFRDALNERHKPNSSAASASLLELAAGAKMSDLDELRELLASLHLETHTYLTDLQGVEVQQNMVFLDKKSTLDAKRTALMDELRSLESTRVPDKKLLEATKADYISCQTLKAKAEELIAYYEQRLERKQRALAAIEKAYLKQEAQRDAQLSTLDRLDQAIKEHDGDVAKIYSLPK